MKHQTHATRAFVSDFSRSVRAAMAATALTTALVLASSLLAGCGSSSAPAGSTSSPSTELADSTTADPVNPTPDTRGATVLLYNGAGVSTSDWQSTQAILATEGLSTELANATQLNSMSLARLATFSVIVVPGGAGGTIYGNLTVAARLKVRQAVRDYGVGYVGFCAGAWVAVAPQADTDQTASYGMAVAKGSVLPAWYPGGDTSRVAAVVPVQFADGSTRQLVWWGGPATPNWSGGVIARYADGKPAISQAYNGKGLVVISGPHPEAPQGWRQTAGTDSDGLDYAIAIRMIKGAIAKAPLAAF